MSCMNIYWVIQYFVNGGQNYNFYLRFGAKLQGGKMTLERWQHHNVTFTQRSVGLLVKSVDFAIFVALDANGDCSKFAWLQLNKYVL